MRNVFAALLVLALTGTTAAAPAATSTKAGIDVFNHAFDQATRAMDDQATLALWEDDGVSLLPGTAPMIGKPALATFLAEIRKQIPGGRMQTFESRCFDLQASCDLASEWCEEHQIVTFADGKPTFDGRGKSFWSYTAAATATGDCAKRCGTRPHHSPRAERHGTLAQRRRRWPVD